MPIEIRQFLSYKETMQNRSPLTVAEYANDLRTFFRYMKAKRNNLRAEDIDGLSIDDIDKAFIVSVTEADIYEFLLYLAYDRRNNPRTRARKLSSLRAFRTVQVMSLLAPSPSPAMERASWRQSSSRAARKAE